MDRDCRTRRVAPRLAALVLCLGCCGSKCALSHTVADQAERTARLGLMLPLMQQQSTVLGAALHTLIVARHQQDERGEAEAVKLITELEHPEVRLRVRPAMTTRGSSDDGEDHATPYFVTSFCMPARLLCHAVPYSQVPAENVTALARKILMARTGGSARAAPRLRR